MTSVALFGLTPAAADNVCDEDLNLGLPCSGGVYCSIEYEGTQVCPVDWPEDMVTCVHVGDGTVYCFSMCSGAVVVAVAGACEDCYGTLLVVAVLDSCSDDCFSGGAVVAVEDSCLDDCTSETLLLAGDDSCLDECNSGDVLLAYDDSCRGGCRAGNVIVAADDSCLGRGCYAYGSPSVIVAIDESCRVTNPPPPGFTTCSVTASSDPFNWICLFVPLEP